ncbi:MAG: hypothetical protein WCP26_10175 [Actinomycetes bacterium]
MGLSRVRRAAEHPVVGGAVWAPIDWDASDPRVQSLRAFIPKVRPEQWSANLLLVVDLVLRTRFVSITQDRKVASTLHEFMCWAFACGYSLDPQGLLCGDRIDEFVTHRYPNPASTATYRWRLRLVGSTVFPGPAEIAISRTAPLPPHTADDRLRHIAAAERIPVRTATGAAMHRDVMVLLGLSYGAGCNALSLHQVREGWLRREHEAWWLDRPDRDAACPIAEPFASALAEARTGDPEAWLLRPGSPTQRSQQAGKVLDRTRTNFPALVGFDINRAARRWEVDLLAACGFGAVAAVLGYRPGRQVPGDLVPHLPPITADQALLDIHNRLTKGA